MKRELIKHVLNRQDWGAHVTVGGWLRTRRDSKGGFSFLEFNDGSCFANLQVLVDKDVPGYDDQIREMFPGSAAVVTGKLVQSPGQGQTAEVHASKVEVCGHSDPACYPLQKQLPQTAHSKLRLSQA